MKHLDKASDMFGKKTPFPAPVVMGNESIMVCTSASMSASGEM
jgi:hypothetical protein